jgi:hypothetical protein
MLASLLVLTSAARAGALLGADLVPSGRGDLAWVLDGRSSDSLSSESDGLLTPPLTLWGGWLGGQNALLAGLSVQRSTTWTWSGEDVAKVTVGGLRPSLDARRYLRPRDAGRPTPWLQLGLWGVVPSARSRNSAWTAEEQAAYDEQSAEDRASIGGVGLRAGPGAEVLFENGLGLGLRGDLGLYQASARTTSEVSRTWVLSTQAALVLSLSL